METCNPAISGDLGGLEDFGKVDLTQPPVHLEDSKVIVCMIHCLIYFYIRNHSNRYFRQVFLALSNKFKSFTR